MNNPQNLEKLNLNHNNIKNNSPPTNNYQTTLTTKSIFYTPETIKTKYPFIISNNKIMTDKKIIITNTSRNQKITQYSSRQSQKSSMISKTQEKSQIPHQNKIIKQYNNDMIKNKNLVEVIMKKGPVNRYFQTYVHQNQNTKNFLKNPSLKMLIQEQKQKEQEIYQEIPNKEQKIKKQNNNISIVSIKKSSNSKDKDSSKPNRKINQRKDNFSNAIKIHEKMVKNDNIARKSMNRTFYQDSISRRCSMKKINGLVKNDSSIKQNIMNSKNNQDKKKNKKISYRFRQFEQTIIEKVEKMLDLAQSLKSIKHGQLINYRLQLQNKQKYQKLNHYRRQFKQYLHLQISQFIRQSKILMNIAQISQTTSIHLTQKIHQVNNKKNQLQSRYEQCRTQCVSLRLNTQRQLKQKQSKINKLQLVNLDLKFKESIKFKQIREENKFIKNNIQNMLKSNKSISKINKELNQYKDYLENKYLIIQKNIKILEKQKLQLQLQQNKKKQQSNKIINNFKEQLYKMKNKLKQRVIQSEILKNQNYSKYKYQNLYNLNFILINNLEQKMNLQIKQSIILYQYNNNYINQIYYQNKNPHLFIDHKKNLLILIRLKTGQIVGGFSEKDLNKEINQIKQWKQYGCIFSLTNNQWFELKREQNAKVLCYDENSIVFGNQELKIQRKQDKSLKVKQKKWELQSNFAFKLGICYFDNNEQNFKKLVPKRTVDIQSFQVHQIIFQK